MNLLLCVPPQNLINMIPGTATVVRIGDITQIPDGERVALARIGDMQSVVEQHLFHPTQLAIFISEHSVLPPELIDYIGAAGKLSGHQGRTVKQRTIYGCCSQGILIPIPTKDGIEIVSPVFEGQDVTDALGIQPSSHLNRS